jgi:hypothetical protein
MKEAIVHGIRAEIAAAARSTDSSSTSTAP